MSSVSLSPLFIRNKLTSKKLGRHTERGAELARRAILRTGGMDPLDVAAIPRKELRAAVVKQAQLRLVIVDDVEAVAPVVSIGPDPYLYAHRLVELGEQTMDEAASLVTALTGRLVEPADLLRAWHGGDVA